MTRELTPEEYDDYAERYPQVRTVKALLRQNGMMDPRTSLSADNADAILATARREAQEEREQATVARAGGRLLTSKLAERVEDFREHYVTLPTGKGLGEHVEGETPIWIAALRGDLGQEKVNDCWRNMIDPAYASSFKDAWTSAAEREAHVGTFSGFGPEDPTVTAVMLREAEAMMSWPIYRAAIEGEAYTDHLIASGTVAECEAEMRRLTDGERGCANPEEHAR